MTNKELYDVFCSKTYVPIYSKSWWLDAICGPDNWDVWIYETGGNVLAAMPYYFEMRGNYKYITKAMLTQNNGIIFYEDSNRKSSKNAEFQEKVINAACDYIESLNLDVYEQQYAHSFNNWSPFFWRNYTAVLRYTYIIEDTSNMDEIWNNISSSYRNEIKKGQSKSEIKSDLPSDIFYNEHEKIFKKQGLECPFDRDLWQRLYDACKENNAGKTYYTIDENGNITSILYLIWDEKYVYHLLGGSIPEYSSIQAYPALTYYGINVAHEKGLSYDFEGSMIKRIAKSFRQFGGTPTPYYRIRKVFNPEIVKNEAEEYIKRLQNERCEQC